MISSTLLRILIGLTTFTFCVLGAALKQITSFGSNPTNVGTYIYVPDKVPSNPAIIVSMHYCTGTAQTYFSGTQYATLADQYGFIVIYPNASDSGGCWDVHTNATLTHNAGGDSLDIASMVWYALTTYSADASRVFMTGTSSGAVMADVPAGAYRDLFKAGAAFSGMPYGCFEGPNMWNSACADGDVIMTVKQWGDLARSRYPGYTGPRPHLQIWHGTADATLYYQNLVEANKQWTNVFDVAFSHNNTNTPLSGYTQMIYGDGTEYVAYSAVGVGHTVPVREGDVSAWFGITTSAGTGGSGGGSGAVALSYTVPTSSSAPATTLATSVKAQRHQQRRLLRPRQQRQSVNGPNAAAKAGRAGQPAQREVHAKPRISGLRSAYNSLQYAVLIFVEAGRDERRNAFGVFVYISYFTGSLTGGKHARKEFLTSE